MMPSPDITDALARLDDELAGDLDLAVIDAYEDLRRQVQAGGREAFEEVDMARSSTTWRKALERARDIPLLPMFRHLILPEARWKALMNTWYAELAEITKATNWQAHSARGAMSGALKKRLGLMIASELVADRGRVYKIIL